MLKLISNHSLWFKNYRKGKKSTWRKTGIAQVILLCLELHKKKHIAGNSFCDYDWMENQNCALSQAQTKCILSNLGYV